MENILQYETVTLIDEEDAMRIIDQTLLPGETRLVDLKRAEEFHEAIVKLRVRGAPAIGVAAAIGIYLAMKHTLADSFDAFYREFSEKKDYLNAARPTAVNLSWALARMEKKLLSLREGFDTKHALSQLREEALLIRDEDIEVCYRIGENGLTLVKKGDGVLTHCNAGQLATVKYGTATAPIYLGHERGYGFKVYCDETRPLLQGARLTAYELMSAGVDTTLLCDNMSASAMRAGWIQAVFTGCDRVAANGDAANKIGTSMVALAAKRYHIPFYICAPTSTIDLDTATGEGIVIELRDADEVTEMWYRERMAPEDVHVYNPAFDVTDADLITGIVTEYGVLYPPYTESIRALFVENGIER